MSKFSGSQFSVLLVDGYNLAAAITENVSMGKESITQQSNPFGVGSEEHSPIGLMKGMLSAGGGFYDPETDALHNVVGTVIGISRIVCAAIEDNIIGRHFMGFEGAYSQKYEVMDKRDGLTMANVAYLISGDADEGAIVQNLATFTADWDTKTGGAGVTDAPVDYALDPAQRPIPITSVSKENPGVITTPIAHRLTTGQKVLISGNNLATVNINVEVTATVLTDTTFSIGIDTTTGTGAGTGGQFVLCSTVAGGIGYLQATDYSGFTDCVNKIMHSPDDITYAALITFTAFGVTGGPKKERKTVSGTVDRYLSNNGDVTGAGSVTIFSGFCRN